MDLYLAGEHECKNGNKIISWDSINILESYYYAAKNKHFARLVKTAGKLLLDSGAFTFIKNNHTADWDRYLNLYANFINKYGIDMFFELDIDPLVGIKKVEQMREKLLQLTGKQPIPVWHKSRGKQYFIDMCKSYSYIALGGIALKEIPRRKFESYFPWFINTAHNYKCKIHGLGYTGDLKKYHFDSVDSSAWIRGNIGSYLYKFNPTIGKMEQIKKEGCRVRSFATAQHNFNEWVKFSKYAKIYF